jgi:hypothetical protein
VVCNFYWAVSDNRGCGGECVFGGRILGEGEVFLHFFADRRAWFEESENKPRIDEMELERAKRRIVF